MKYELKTPIFKDNYARNLLKSRGVEDYDSFINPTKEFLSDPLDLNNVLKGIELLLKHIHNNNKIITIVDSDADGFTSAAIIWQRILECNPDANLSYKLHSGKQHGLEDLIEEIENESDSPALVILPDSSSNDYEYHARLKAIGVDILVLDHHEAEHESLDAVVINNQLSENYKNKELTGAGVTWQFCRQLDKVLNEEGLSDKYMDLAALGIVSDMASVIEPENRYIISTGMSNIHNFLFKTIVEKQAYSINGSLAPWKLSFYVTPLINAMIRVGTAEEKENLFLAFIDGEKIVDSTKRGAKGEKEDLATQVTRDCSNARNRQNRIKEKAVEQLKIKIINDDLLSNKILFIKLDDENDFPSVLNGLIATQLSVEYKLPTIIARMNDEGFYRGSIRGLSNSELKDFKGFLTESNLVEYCEG